MKVGGGETEKGMRERKRKSGIKTAEVGRREAEE